MRPQQRLALLGFAALSYSLFAPGLSTTSLLVWMGLGALMIFLGVALLAERLVRPLATVLGWPAAKFGGVAGMLARENTERNTQRTASTASALMIGRALVTLVTLLAAGGWGLTRRALRPVDRMSQSALRISAEDLSRRLERRGTGDEIDRLADTLNAMLARLQAAFG